LAGFAGSCQQHTRHTVGQEADAARDGVAAIELDTMASFAQNSGTADRAHGQ
jgi:hypothetical protein